MSGRNGAMPRSSGDVIADRRYDIAAAYVERGDFDAAADLLEQVLERAERWPAAWHALAKAREAQGRTEAAVAAYRRAVALDANDELGASLDLARLGADLPPDIAPEHYVTRLFDQYAKRFETHLLGELDYRAPALLREAVGRCRSRKFAHVVDLGCGTGLCGAAFRASTEILTGVDLSGEMIAEATAKNLYDALHRQGLAAFLQAARPESIDLLLAADVLVYVGNLAPIFELAHRALHNGGLFAFTLQRGPEHSSSDETRGFRIAGDLRYSHDRHYVETLARRRDFALRICDEASPRREAGADVPGFVVVLQKA